ncbi:unnamed protein product [Oikopleura dioica]|uniref:Uncharacterized protein n=1 Tax=Oikopleura dioica TaxID=34765 RepID=E4Z6S9_OIKDI|nr:unnamed protein product [Oikopleura dioica]
MLNDMEISGQIKQLNQPHEGERKEWKNETRKMGEKMEALELNLRNEIEKKHELEELEMMRKELGDIGGAGHFFGNDKRIKYGGERDAMGEEELKKVLRLLAYWWDHNLEVAEAGWTIQFKTALKRNGGDGKYHYLWISNKEFKATAQEISDVTGEEANRRELQSKKDGTRQRIKYEMVAYKDVVRFNITFL